MSSRDKDESPRDGTSPSEDRSAISADQVHRFLFDESAIRGEIVTLATSFEEATAHQQLHPVAKQLLGEFLATVSLLAGALKFEGVLTLQARGDGPVPLVMAESTDTGNIRGIVKPKDGVDLNALEGAALPDLVGQGVLTLTIDPARGKRYQGIVPLEGASIADCLSGYFAQSEQLPTHFWLAVRDDIASGFLLQALPPASGSPADPEIWLTASQLASTVKAEELLQLPHATVLSRLFNEFEVRIFEPTSVQFACSCTRDRSGNALLSLGPDDAFALLAERDIITIDCQFCGQVYTFNEEDLQRIFGQQKNLH